MKIMVGKTYLWIWQKIISLERFRRLKPADPLS